MSGKSSISKAKSYKEIGAFWDEHDATEFGEQIDAEFEVDIHSQLRYYPIDNHFIKNIRHLAEERGISEVTLINLWIQEKITQADASKKVKEAV
jgi:hypothetical protein